MQIDAIILAGGAGKRLWPQSRKTSPKHLLKLSDDGDTLLYMTIIRTLLLAPQRVLIITNKDYSKEVYWEIDKVKGSEEYLKLIEKQDILFTVIQEPQSMNTAPAVATGAYVLNSDNNSNVAVMFPSDHLITNEQFFLQAIKSAYSIAKKGYVVTLGIAPTGPATGYGYIETENRKGKRWYTVKSFKEKPDEKTANKYFNSENYYYNSGMLIFRPVDMIKEFDKHMPGLSNEMRKIKGVNVADPAFGRLLAQIYKDIEPESIDYGILEKSKNVAVVPAGFKWSDLGSWASLYDVLEKDDNGNVLTGDVIQINSTGSFIRGGKRLVAAAGINDLIVIDSDDALLICDRGSAEGVKAIVNLLEEKGHKKLT